MPSDTLIKIDNVRKTYAGKFEALKGVNLEIMLMNDFYKMLRRKGLYYGIDNLENKNYLGTRQLIYQLRSNI